MKTKKDIKAIVFSKLYKQIKREANRNFLKLYLVGDHISDSDEKTSLQFWKTVIVLEDNSSISSHIVNMQLKSLASKFIKLLTTDIEEYDIILQVDIKEETDRLKNEIIVSFWYKEHFEMSYFK